jgi:cold shock CspA family protein
MQGVVTEFDKKAGVGLIDADDGGIVLFNRANLRADDARTMAVGTRVKFHAHEDALGRHADYVIVGRH